MTELDHPRTDGVVVIRGFDTSDRPALIAGRDEEFHRFLGEGSPEPAPSACICVEDAIVSWIDYEHDRDWLDEHEVNVGYNVFLEYRGRGYGTSALRLLCGFLDAQNPPLVPTLLIDPHNGPSLALGRRAGFEDVGEINGQRFLRRAAARPQPAFRR